MKNTLINSTCSWQILCESCGSKIDSRSHSYCASCGNKISHGSISATQSFITAATKGRNEIWRYVVGILLALIIWQLIGPLPFLGACGTLSLIEILGYRCELELMSITGPSQVPGFTLTMLTFVIGLIGLQWTIKWIHHRDLLQVLTGRIRFDLSRFLFSSVIVLCFSSLTLFCRSFNW